jgi:hypothetical protein
LRSALAALWHLFVTSALIAGLIYFALLAGEALFPGAFNQKIGLQHLALLVGVAFIPRLIYWAVGLILAGRRRRKRRKA